MLRGPAMPGGRVDPITGAFVTRTEGEALGEAPAATRVPVRIHSKEWDRAHRFQTTASAIGAHLRHASSWGVDQHGLFDKGGASAGSVVLPEHEARATRLRGSPIYELKTFGYAGRLDAERAKAHLGPSSGHTFLPPQAMARILQTTQMVDQGAASQMVDAEGDAHQKSLRVAPSPKGMGDGTGPFQGGRSASSALRGGGIVTAPWPAASAGSARATAARRCAIGCAPRSQMAAPARSSRTVSSKAIAPPRCANVAFVPFCGHCLSRVHRAR